MKHSSCRQSHSESVLIVCHVQRFPDGASGERLCAEELLVLDTKQRTVAPAVRITKAFADMADVFVRQSSVKKTPQLTPAAVTSTPIASGSGSSGSAGKASPGPALGVHSATVDGGIPALSAAPVVTKPATSPTARTASPASPAAAPPSSPTRLQTSAMGTPGSASTSNRSAGTSNESGAKPLSLGDQQLLATLLRKGQEAVDARSYRHGAEIYQQVRGSAYGRSFPTCFGHP